MIWTFIIWCRPLQISEWLNYEIIIKRKPTNTATERGEAHDYFEANVYLEIWNSWNGVWVQLWTFCKFPNGSTWSILLGVVYFAFKINCIFKLSLRYTFWILITTLRSCWTAFCWFVYILRIVCKYNNYVPLYKRGMMSVTCWLFSHGMIIK